METFSDERLMNHRGYNDAGIPLMRYMKTVGESLTNFSTVLLYVPVGDVRAMSSSPSIPVTGRIELITAQVKAIIGKQIEQSKKGEQ